jgi:hypothetical protein
VKPLALVSRRTMIAATAFAAVQQALGQPAAPERLFTFRQSFWLNLHHFLYVLGRARNNEPDSRRGTVAEAPIESQEILDRTEPDRSAWDKAISNYANSVSKKDLVFDRDLSRLTQAIDLLHRGLRRCQNRAGAPSLRGNQRPVEQPRPGGSGKARSFLEALPGWQIEL